MTPLTDIEAGQLIDWMEEEDAATTSGGLRHILPDGWSVEICPDGDIRDGRLVDASTVAVTHYSREIDPGEWGNDLLRSANRLSRIR
jgi:hypothetical protein